MAIALGGEGTPGDAVQFGVHEGCQALKRTRVAAAPGLHQARQFNRNCDSLTDTDRLTPLLRLYVSFWM